jgi:hypothetical protein
MRSVLLIASSVLLASPTIYVFYTNGPWVEKALASMLGINALLSIAFWSNPVKNTIVHRADAICGRTSIVVFTVYMMFIKTNASFFAYSMYMYFLELSLLFFMCSSIESSKEWFTKTHILYHFLFHLCIMSGCFAVLL